MLSMSDINHIRDLYQSGYKICEIHKKTGARELNFKVPPLQTSERKLIFPKRKWNLVLLKDYNAVLWSDLLLRQNRRNPNGQIQTDDPGRQNHYRTRTR